jgi:Domain of unknown function (DUF1707)
MTRASDADRERALRELRRHYAAGRLEERELEERAARAAAAKTRNELRLLLFDLPRDAREKVGRAAATIDRMALRAHVVVYGTFNGALVGTWALAGAGEFWPAWSLLPWGAVLAGHAWCSRAVRRALGGPPRRRQLAR